MVATWPSPWSVPDLRHGTSGHDMSADSRSEQLQALVAGSQRMLQLAEAGDWESVDRLQILRQQLAEAFFAIPVDGREVAGVEAAIRQILASDEKIAGLGRQQRDLFEQEIKDFRRRRHAALQYSANHTR